jgi:hypothetical protein
VKTLNAKVDEQQKTLKLLYAQLEKMNQLASKKK